jgi:hypothetical protein
MRAVLMITKSLISGKHPNCVNPLSMTVAAFGYSSSGWRGSTLSGYQSPYHHLSREQTIPNARCQQTRTPEQRTLLNLPGFLTPNPLILPVHTTRSSNNSKKSPKQLGYFTQMPSNTHPQKATLPTSPLPSGNGTTYAYSLHAGL